MNASSRVVSTVSVVFQYRGVGPDIEGFKVGGDFMVLNSLEYQVSRAGQ